MFARRAFLFVVIGLTLFASCRGAVSAHDLLPPALVEYIQTHPNATPQELDAFLQANPDLSSNPSTDSNLSTIETARGGDVSFWQNAKNFIVLGIKHILTGSDHLLFVLSLLIFFVVLVDIFYEISMFTLAHTITLILSGLDVIRLNPHVVESIVAFSIAYVAFTSAFLSHFTFFASRRNKMIGVFVFGLFHGMGFAGLLRELAIPDDRFLSSLLFFNGGIELGQLLIIALVLPFIVLFHKARWYPVAVKMLALIITGLALTWCTTRVYALFV